jgi:putative SOS response-associated peptidase YedK
MTAISRILSIIAHASRSSSRRSAKRPLVRTIAMKGFVIVTNVSIQGMFDIHDRRPLVLQPDTIREWLSEDASVERASEIVHECALPKGDFKWHKVDNAVGNTHNQVKVLIEPV